MTRRRVGSRLLAALAVLGLAATGAAAQQQASVMGQVTDEAGTPLASVQVVVTHQVTGAQRGTYTNEDGRYLIRGLNPRGPYRIEARRIGFGTDFVEVAGLDAAETQQFDFSLGNEAVSLDAIEVFASRARDQQTPVAYSSVDEIQIKRQLASRDLPLVLNTKPSVYATEGGGGSGDARINVRGFDQRNVAVMLNGVPVNDMESGWVYWSNWDGVGDFTESIQLQRGMSAVNLATASIGGSLNLITDPSSMDTDLMLKQEFGDEGFLKTTAMASTGLIDGKFALMAGGIRKTGDGLVQGAWTDAWAYYFAGTWILNNANRLDLYATGAPQRHGQRRYAQNIGTFDADYALGLDSYDAGALDDYGRDHPEGTGSGRLYNQNVSPISCSYDAPQYVGDDSVDRQDCGFLNEIENFYHKPQVNLNWFSQLTEDLKLSTVAYYSGGSGGGTGTLGSMVWNYDSPSRVVDWDATIERNRASTDGSTGILRNSRNNQWTVGAISKLQMDVGSDLTLEVGVDARMAEIEHYREVRDLLGGDYFIDDSNDFAPDFQAGLGDKVDYYNTNEVSWIGGHLQGQYYTGPMSAYGMVGLSGVKYNFTDHFRRGSDGDALNLEADWQPAFQVKGGGLYNLTESLGVFANAGYVEQMPIFDQVIDDVSGDFVANPENQKYMSVEAGARYKPLDLPLEFSGNVYYTQWLDRVSTRRFTLEEGDITEDIFVTMTGLQQRHYGIELEAGYQPHDMVRFDVASAFNSWEYTDDVTGVYKPESRDTTFSYDIYTDGLKVGNAPQMQLAYSATVFPVDGAYIQLVGKTFMDHYADFNPFDRTCPVAPGGDASTVEACGAEFDGGVLDEEGLADRGVQPWKVPNYTVLDAHAGFSIPPSFTRGLEVEIFANVFNVLDEVYVMDALDNSQYNAYDNDHDADDAEVFFGLPRRFTVGASILY
jgi:iron complex outermembrane receptor protein